MSIPKYTRPDSYDRGLIGWGDSTVMYTYAPQGDAVPAMQQLVHVVSLRKSRPSQSSRRGDWAREDCHISVVMPSAPSNVCGEFSISARSIGPAYSTRCDTLARIDGGRIRCFDAEHPASRGLRDG